MIDRENVIENLEQNIRWIEEIECHQFPGWGNVTMAMRDALELLKEQGPEIVRCEDCKYFEIKDFWGEFNGIPVLGASDQPTCTKWGDGDCKTSPDGYCFLAERR